MKISDKALKPMAFNSNISATSPNLDKTKISDKALKQKTFNSNVSTAGPNLDILSLITGSSIKRYTVRMLDNV